MKNNNTFTKETFNTIWLHELVEIIKKCYILDEFAIDAPEGSVWILDIKSIKPNVDSIRNVDSILTSKIIDICAISIILRDLCLKSKIASGKYLIKVQ